MSRFPRTEPEIAALAVEVIDGLVNQWEGTEGNDTLVTVEFNDVNGSTEVVLTHELFTDQAQKADHEQGWASCLNRLEKMFA